MSVISRHGAEAYGGQRAISKSASVLNSHLHKSVSLGDYVTIYNSTLEEFVAVQRFSEIIRSRVNSFSYLATNARLIETEVGKFCAIGPNVVCGCGEHPTHWLSISPVFYSNLRQCGISFVDESHFDELRQVTIGSDCWIGANVVIRNGVNIGHGAIVAAGSVVTGDVPPYAVAAGLPAKVKRFRFDQATISKLLDSKWWDKPPNFLKQHTHLFRGDDAQKLIAILEEDVPGVFSEVPRSEV